MTDTKKNEAIAREYNFDVWHTGGGCLAFGQVAGTPLKEEYHLLVTCDDGISIDGDPNEKAWIVGLYSDVDDGDFVNFEETFTLRDAIESAWALPLPAHDSDVWGQMFDTVKEFIANKGERK